MHVTNEFENRVVLITGASRGIGFATAQRFLESGARVAICARNPANLEHAFAALAERHPGRVAKFTADMADTDSIPNLIDAVASHVGSVDMLVNNAGEVSLGDVETMPEDTLRRQLDTKLFGFWRAMRLVYPAMKERGFGRIVNIIGGAGKEPDPRSFGSSVTNAALLSLTKTASLQWAPHGVLVNAVCPGFIQTGLWDRNAAELKNDFGGKTDAEMRTNAARRNAMNRFGAPEEVAEVIHFLCSGAASYLSGVTINVDGNRLKSLW